MHFTGSKPETDEPDFCQECTVAIAAGAGDGKGELPNSSQPPSKIPLCKDSLNCNQTNSLMCFSSLIWIKHFLSRFLDGRLFVVGI